MIELAITIIAAIFGGISAWYTYLSHKLQAESQNLLQRDYEIKTKKHELYNSIAILPSDISRKLNILSDLIVLLIVIEKKPIISRYNIQDIYAQVKQLEQDEARRRREAIDKIANEFRQRKKTSKTFWIATILAVIVLLLKLFLPNIRFYESKRTEANAIYNINSKAENNLSEAEIHEIIRNFNSRGIFERNRSYKIYPLLVYDKSTEKMWKIPPTDELYFRNAESQIKELNERRFAGYSDWRLPTVEELLSLLKKDASPGTYFVDTQVATTGYRFWSSDRYKHEDEYWMMNKDGTFDRRQPIYALDKRQPNYWKASLIAVRNAN